MPGKKVSIDAPCLDCGESIHIEMRDGDILNSAPTGIVGYVAVAFREWFTQLPFA